MRRGVRRPKCGSEIPSNLRGTAKKNPIEGKKPSQKSTPSFLFK